MVTLFMGANLASGETRRAARCAMDSWDIAQASPALWWGVPRAWPRIVKRERLSVPRAGHGFTAIHLC